MAVIAQLLIALCNACQWTYTAGNNWGLCEDGTNGQGCGPQETFRACADISVTGPPVGENTVSTTSAGTTQFKYVKEAHLQEFFCTICKLHARV